MEPPKKKRRKLEQDQHPLSQFLLPDLIPLVLGYVGSGIEGVLCPVLGSVVFAQEEALVDDEATAITADQGRVVYCSEDAGGLGEIHVASNHHVAHEGVPAVGSPILRGLELFFLDVSHQLTIYNLETKQIVQRWQLDHNYSENSLAVDADGQRVFLRRTSYDRSDPWSYVWDRKSATIQRFVQVGRKLWHSTEVCADGKLFALDTVHPFLMRVYDSQTAELLHKWNVPELKEQEDIHGFCVVVVPATGDLEVFVRCRLSSVLVLTWRGEFIREWTHDRFDAFDICSDGVGGVWISNDQEMRRYI